MPRISVVIPNYNHAAYIVETLDHIVRQTLRDWELVVIDDGSTDASLEILSRYQSRLRVLRSEHRGPAAARNIGIAATDAEYIAFIDADDLCEPRRFELQIHKLQNENLDLVASALSFIDAQGWPIPGLWTCPPHARRDYWASLVERNWIGTPSVMLRRSVLSSTGVFDEEFTHAEDYDLWLRVGRSYSIGILNGERCRRSIRPRRMTRSAGCMRRNRNVTKRGLDSCCGARTRGFSMKPTVHWHGIRGLQWCVSRWECSTMTPEIMKRPGQPSSEFQTRMPRRSITRV